MSISRRNQSSNPRLAVLLDRDGSSIRRQFGVFMVAALAAVSVAAILVLGLLWPLAPDEELWGWQLIAWGDEARAWISIGVRPVGFVAIGGQPTGVFALGLVPIGVFSFGLYSLGVFSVGMFAAGLVSSGAGAAGWLSLAYDLGSAGWYSYADGPSVGAYSWGRGAAYGYHFASARERPARPQGATRVRTSRSRAPPPVGHILASASERHGSQGLVVSISVIACCGVVGLLVVLGVLDPLAPNGGLLGWQELVASRDEPWGWISVGERPVGVVAIGQQPTGVIALGVFPVGVISVGVISAGVFSVGVMAIGVLSLGASAVGWMSVGTFSTGWYAYAHGGTAVGAYSWGWRAYGLFGAYGRVGTSPPPAVEKLFHHEIP